MNENALQLWIRKTLPSGPIDAGLAMATWPKALMVLVSRRDDMRRAAAFLTDAAGLEFGRLTLILLNAIINNKGEGGTAGALTEETLDAEFGPHGFSPFVRGKRTLRSRAHTASYVDASKIDDGVGVDVAVVEFNSTIKGVLPATVLLVPGPTLPSVSMVGTFDRAWSRAQDFQLRALHALLRPNARMLLSVREPAAADNNDRNNMSAAGGDEVSADKNADMRLLPAAEALGLKPHIVGQALVSLEGSACSSVAEMNDRVLEKRDRVAAVAASDNAVTLRDVDYLVQLPGDKTNMNFRVSCYCCQ